MGLVIDTLEALIDDETDGIEGNRKKFGIHDVATMDLKKIIETSPGEHIRNIKDIHRDFDDKAKQALGFIG